MSAPVGLLNPVSPPQRILISLEMNTSPTKIGCMPWARTESGLSALRSKRVRISEMIRGV
jgi:hypothetical protein